MGFYFFLSDNRNISSLNLSYTYDATGKKLRKTVNSTTTEYIDGIQYTGSNIDFVQTEEGRILNPTGTPNYEYTLTDHLGNSRVSFDSSHGGTTATQTDDYYPFGLVSSQPNTTSPKNNYLYNKKELQDELGQYDYGARFYDPVIGRWTSVDPLADRFKGMSPYNYGNNNPIRNIDPNGMLTYDWNSQTYKDDKGKDVSSQDAMAQLQNMGTNVYKAPEVEEPEPDNLLNGGQQGGDGGKKGNQNGGKQNENNNSNNPRSNSHQPTQKPPVEEVQKVFPGAEKVKGPNGRVTWRLPDGTYLQWDKQHGEYEVFDKTGNIHLGVKDRKGQWTEKPAHGKGRSIYKMENQPIITPLFTPSPVPVTMPTMPPVTLPRVWIPELVFF